LEKELQIKKQETSQKAKDCLSEFLHLEEQYSDPIDMLWKGVNWSKYIFAPMDQQKLQESNKVFDLHSCYGRIVLAVLLVEKYFPDSKIEIGEVVVDGLAQRMLKKITETTDPTKKMEIAQEILMYEEPHFIIVVDGFEFDPISVVMRHQINHPKVIKHDTWSAITAGYIMNEALCKYDLNARDIDLQMADLFCHLRSIEQNRLGVAMAFNPIYSRERAEKFISVYPNARIMYIMWRELGNTSIFDVYPREVFEALNQEMEVYLAQ
jgi:hypothetical protein